MSREKLEVGDRVWFVEDENGQNYYTFGTVSYLSPKGTMARVDWDPGYYMGQRIRTDRLNFLDTFEVGDIVEIALPLARTIRVGIVSYVWQSDPTLDVLIEDAGNGTWPAYVRTIYCKKIG